MESVAYITSNIFTSRVTPNHKTFLGQHALGARPWLSRMADFTARLLLYELSPSKPRLEWRDPDSHHATRGPHSPSGGRCSYALRVFTSRTLAIRDIPTVIAIQATDEGPLAGTYSRTHKIHTLHLKKGYTTNPEYGVLSKTYPTMGYDSRLALVECKVYIWLGWLDPQKLTKVHPYF